MPINDIATVRKEDNTSRVSVIIATYNAAATLQACLDSVTRQAYPHIEIIIIDGKSTDSTVAIIQQNSSKIAYWESEKDTGVYVALNKALRHISGNWIYFLGADDELLPGFSDMATQLTDISAIYYANVFAEGAKRLGELTRYRFAKYGPYHQAMIYPKAVFEKYRFNTQYKISSDFALTLELCGDKAFHFIYKDYVIANFNHTGLSGEKIDALFQKDKAGLIFKNFGIKIWLRYMIHRFKHRDNPRV